jgi:hypothetical protein
MSNSQHGDTVYQVYLLEDDPNAGVESPVTGRRLDFFDSGVWVECEDSRDFFPYERVSVVRERAAEEGDLENEE